MADIDHKTDAASGFVFDFQKAIEEARRDYPRQTKNITFIDGSDPAALEDLHKWAVAQKIKPGEWEGMLAMMEDEGAFSHTGHAGGKIVVVPTKKSPDKMRLLDDPHKSNQLSFDHELGHMIMPEGTGPTMTTQEYFFNNLLAQRGQMTTSDVYGHQAEYAADSFAAIRGIRRGSLDKADISHLASLHDGAFLLRGDLLHFTSIAFDSVIINPQDTHFTSLSPKEVIRIAHQHMKAASTEKIDELFFAIKVLERDSDLTLPELADKRLRALANVCEKHEGTSKEFYIAARLVKNVLEKGRFQFGSSDFAFDSKSDYWQGVSRMIDEKAGKRDIGAKKAMLTESFTKAAKRNPVKAFISRFKTPQI